MTDNNIRNIVANSRTIYNAARIADYRLDSQNIIPLAVEVELEEWDSEIESVVKRRWLQPIEGWMDYDHQSNRWSWCFYRTQLEDIYDDQYFLDFIALKGKVGGIQDYCSDSTIDDALQSGIRDLWCELCEVVTNRQSQFIEQDSDPITVKINDEIIKEKLEGWKDNDEYYNELKKILEAAKLTIKPIVSLDKVVIKK